MTENATPTTNRPSKRRRYRIAMYGALAVGIVGYLFALRIEQPVAALVVYWGGFLGFLGVSKGSPVTLYDERHEMIKRHAAARTVGIVGAALILVGPALPALSGAGYEPPTLVVGALYGYAAMFGVYGAVCLWMRFWP